MLFNKINFNSQKGFTMIEIIITLSVLAILILGLSNIYSWILDSYMYSRDIILEQSKIENTVKYLNRGLKEGIIEIKNNQISFNNNDTFYKENNKLFYNDKLIAFNVDSLEIKTDNNFLEVNVDDKKIIFYYSQ